MQLLLFHLHILCSTLHTLPERGPHTPLDLLHATFKLDGFRRELAEESKEKINGRVYNPEYNAPRVQQLNNVYFYMHVMHVMQGSQQLPDLSKEGR